MDQAAPRHEITTKRLVYDLPGMDAVPVRRDVAYRTTDAGVLAMDVYYPPEATDGSRRPAVVFVIGYSDLGARAMLGCAVKDMVSFISWAQLVAISGLTAITYTTGAEPASDVHAVMDYLRQNAASLGVDENRIGVWACSGHVPNALAVLMQGRRESLKCAVLCYGFMLDIDGATGVAEAAKTFRFVNPNAGRSVDDLPQDVPVFVVRDGRDELPGLNESIDRFVAKALTRDLPITVMNHADAPHAFDIMHDSETSRDIIRRILSFMQFHLRTRP